MPTITIGSRGSPLALWQAEWAREWITAAGTTARIEIIHSLGDRVQDAPFARIGAKGVFTKELDDALLSGRVDCCIHSLKDVPTTLPEGLTLAGIPARAPAGDALIGRTAPTLKELPRGARVGTCSLRRRAMLAAVRPDVTAVDLRGNVDTRLNKLDAGSYDAIILAQAGLERLNLGSRITEALTLDLFIPAPGQGALALVGRSDDPATTALLNGLTDADTEIAVTAERHLLARLEGGCEIPLGAHARVDGATLRLDAAVCALDGKRILRSSAEGSSAAPQAVADHVFDTLARQGAVELVAEIRRHGIRPA